MEKRFQINTLVALTVSLIAISFRPGTLSDFSPSAMYVIGFAPFVMSFLFVPFIIYLQYIIFFERKISQKHIWGLLILYIILLLTHPYTFLFIATPTMVYLLISFVNKYCKNKNNIAPKYLLFILLGILIIGLALIPKDQTWFSASKSNLIALMQLITNRGDHYLTEKTILFNVFIVAGGLSLYFRKNKSLFYFMAIIFISSILLILFMPKLLPESISQMFLYANIYGRGLLVIKYLMIIFGAFGINLLIDLSKKSSFSIYAMPIIFLMMSAILFDQLNFSLKNIQSTQALKGYNQNNTYFNDINTITQIINSDTNNNFNVLADSSFESPEKFLIPVFSENYNYMYFWQMDKTQLKKKLLINKFYENLDQNFIVDEEKNILNSWDTKYIVLDSTHGKFADHKIKYSQLDFETIYSGKLELMQKLSSL